MDYAADTIARKYEDAVDRLGAAGDALQGRRSDWSRSAVALLAGIGIGAGVGVLLAPMTGRETRQAIRNRATDLKNKVAESTSAPMGSVRASSGIMRPTGTEG